MSRRSAAALILPSARREVPQCGVQLVCHGFIHSFRILSWPYYQAPGCEFHRISTG